MPLEVEVTTTGPVSDLFADEDGPVTDDSDLFFVDLFQIGRRLFSTEVDEVETSFNLADYMLFELRRGDEDSADASELAYTINM